MPGRVAVTLKFTSDVTVETSTELNKLYYIGWNDRLKAKFKALSSKKYFQIGDGSFDPPTFDPNRVDQRLQNIFLTVLMDKDAITAMDAICDAYPYDLDNGIHQQFGWNGAIRVTKVGGVIGVNKIITWNMTATITPVKIPKNPVVVDSVDRWNYGVFGGINADLSSYVAAFIANGDTTIFGAGTIEDPDEEITVESSGDDQGLIALLYSWDGNVDNGPLAVFSMSVMAGGSDSESIFGGLGLPADGRLITAQTFYKLCVFDTRP